MKITVASPNKTIQQFYENKVYEKKVEIITFEEVVEITVMVLTSAPRIFFDFLPKNDDR